MSNVSAQDQGRLLSQKGYAVALDLVVAAAQLEIGLERNVAKILHLALGIADLVRAAADGGDVKTAVEEGPNVVVHILVVVRQQHQQEAGLSGARVADARDCCLDGLAGGIAEGIALGLRQHAGLGPKGLGAIDVDAGIAQGFDEHFNGGDGFRDAVVVAGAAVLDDENGPILEDAALGKPDALEIPRGGVGGDDQLPGLVDNTGGLQDASADSLHLPADGEAEAVQDRVGNRVTEDFQALAGDELGVGLRGAAGDPEHARSLVAAKVRLKDLAFDDVAELRR